MDIDGRTDCRRRRLLLATSLLGGVAGVAVAVPFVSTFAPSQRARSAGAPVEVDVSMLAPGEMKTVEWRGKPVWIIHRTREMLDSIARIGDRVADPDSERPMQPAYAKNQYRSIKPEFMVAIGICTHLGCSPSEKFRAGSDSGIDAEWPGGFLCPCHGSMFDLAGRVFKNKPAPDNLLVPPHHYLSDGRILIGEEGKGA